MRSVDPTAPPRINLDYYREADDLDRLVEGLRRVHEPAHVGPIKELSGGVEFQPGPEVDLRSWVRRSVDLPSPGRHLRDGVDASAGAVVDAACRVHGMTGLRVIDASVMPDIPSANTHLPTVMTGCWAASRSRSTAWPFRRASGG